VDIAVAGRKNPAMLGRVKPDNRRLDARQLEYDLDFLMRLHVMGRIADPVEDVVLDKSSRPVTKNGNGFSASRPAASRRAGSKVSALGHHWVRRSIMPVQRFAAGPGLGLAAHGCSDPRRLTCSKSRAS
jgi:hypothetical protein